MSLFDPNPKTGSIRIIADPATETFVIDHAFRMVARGVGSFSCDVTPGLYKFKFRSGLAVKESYQEIAANSPKPVEIIAPKFAYSSTAPFRNTRRVSDDQLGDAEKISSGPAIKLGNG